MSRVGLVFDVDGVLIETSASFFEVVSSAVDIYCSLFPGLDSLENSFTFEHYRRAKLNPMFNDDYDIAWFFLCWIMTKPELVSGAGGHGQDDWGYLLASCHEDPVICAEVVFKNTADRGTVRKICEELYFGEEIYRHIRGRVPEYASGPGAWRNERALLDRRWDSFEEPVGIYTGRSAAEMELAFGILDWRDFPGQRCVTSCDMIRKPSPEGLFVLERILGVSGLFFFGDTESDSEAFARYGRGRFFPVGEILSDRPGWFPTVRDALADIGI